MFAKGIVLDEHNINSYFSVVLDIVYRQYVLCKILQHHQKPMEAVAGKVEICLGRARSDVTGSTFLPKY